MVRYAAASLCFSQCHLRSSGGNAGNSLRLSLSLSSIRPAPAQPISSASIVFPRGVPIVMRVASSSFLFLFTILREGPRPPPPIFPWRPGLERRPSVFTGPRDLERLEDLKGGRPIPMPPRP